MKNGTVAPFLTHNIVGKLATKLEHY